MSCSIGEPACGRQFTEWWPPIRLSCTSLFLYTSAWESPQCISTWTCGTLLPWCDFNWDRITTSLIICRFNSRLVRCLASGTFILRQVLTLGVTVYTPSVALNTVIGIPYWVSIVGLTAISIFFTILVSNGNSLILESHFIHTNSLIAGWSEGSDYSGCDPGRHNDPSLHCHLCAGRGWIKRIEQGLRGQPRSRPIRVLHFKRRSIDSCRYSVRLGWTVVHVTQFDGVPAKLCATLRQHEELCRS